MTQEPSERTRPALRNPETKDFPTGPAVGDQLPDFELPDQHGESRSFSAIRGADRAYVVFIRATAW